MKRASRQRWNSPPDGGWIWVTREMVGSITFRALSINARRVLDFLMSEHIGNGGQENGYLAAPYRQLAAWGVTEADIRKALEELFVTGFVRLQQPGLRVASGGAPARYALTWLPTKDADGKWVMQTDDWRRVLAKLPRDSVGSVAQAKEWLRQQVASKQRRKKRPTTPHLTGEAPLICETGT